jgi:hypothetical protein
MQDVWTHVLVTQNFDTFLQPNKSSSYTGSTRNTTKHEHLYESNLDALSLDCVTIQDRGANHNQSRP